MSTNFKWSLGEEPPPIEEHSKAKLKVLRSYLREYFNRLNVNPARDRFKLDFVDGFAGGGLFQDGSRTISGTPLIMLEEAAEAAKRLNERRRKKLDFDCRFYFVDKKKAHTDTLKKVLRERGHSLDDGRIDIRTSAFEAEADNIIREIQNRQPQAGRAIFLLDQTGFSQVNLSTIRNIFYQLPAVEIILTFSVDVMLNFLKKERPLIKAYTALELPDTKVLEIIEEKEKPHGKAVAQRILRRHLRNQIGAPFDTPFFFRPGRSYRTLWFIHLSKHPTARNVMIERHWEHQNRFQHYGHGDIGMMGFDAVLDAVSKKSTTFPLFNFAQYDEEVMLEQLLGSLPRELRGLASDEPVTVDAVRYKLANETAAKFSDLNKVIIQLLQEKEIRILNSDGKPIRPRTRLKPTDRIALPENLGFSFPRQKRKT